MSQPGTVSIGRIFGIDIELHWTFLMFILLFMFVGTLAFVSIVLLFACVLVHELAHSLTALRNKVKVRRIVLLPIGGASMIESHNISQKVEFNISIVGPFASLFLAGLFGMLVTITPPGVITQIVQYLFLINLLLGIFNLLPAFPLDGGRAFRSWLRKKHDFFEATMIAVKANKYIIGLFLIGTVAYAILATTSLSYKFFMVVWDLIIVMFLYEGAQSEAQSAIIKQETRGLKLKDSMSTHFITVNPTAQISDVYKKVRKERENIVLSKMGKDYYLIDIFSKRKQALRASDLAKRMPKLEYNMNVFDAIATLEEHDSAIGVVLKRGKLLGIASISHIQSLISLHRLSSSPKSLKDL